MKTDLLNYYSDGKLHSNEDMKKHFKAHLTVKSTIS